MQTSLLLAVLLVSWPENPPPPKELPGSLVLAGAGALPDDVRNAFFEMAGKDKARIVVVSLAKKDGEAAAKEWQKMGAKSVANLVIPDREVASKPDTLKTLGEATGVWFADGDPKQLLDCYREKDLHQALKTLHEKGVVIGGAMGGASMMGVNRLDLLPGFVIVADPKSPHSLNLNIGQSPLVGLSIYENTTVVVRVRSMQVIGKGRVKITLPDGPGFNYETHESGATLDYFQLYRAAVNRSAKSYNPPATFVVKPLPPVVERGSLLIVGGGAAGPEIWKKFLDLAGGPESLIVLIPTAQEDPIARRHPEEAALRQNGAKNVVVLHTRDRKTANDPEFSDVLTRVKGVWFGGGRQWRFLDAYEGTLTERRFHDVLARGGVIGGSSAGASIQGEYMPRGSPLGNTEMMVEGYDKGFGFLPGAAIDQHFFARKRTRDMTALMERYPQFLGIGIDEGTALVVRGRTAEVIGKSSVAFYDYRHGRPRGEKDYEEVKAGGAYDLKKRRAEVMVEK